MNRSIDPHELREKARAVIGSLMWFAVLRSPTPEKRAALDRLQVIRLEIQELMDLLAPGWERTEG